MCLLYGVLTSDCAMRWTLAQELITRGDAGAVTVALRKRAEILRMHRDSDDRGRGLVLGC